jgi:hypothetical protein
MSPSNNQSAGAVQSDPTTGQAPPITPTLNSNAPTSTPNGSSILVATPPPIATIPLPPPKPGAQAQSPQPGAVPATPQSTGPGFLVAEDKDVIEPVWINKAKSIVRHNQDDPYKQSEELTLFKADYMQKRYNKTIKLK